MASHLAGVGWPTYDIPSAAVVRGAPSRRGTERQLCRVVGGTLPLCWRRRKPFPHRTGTPRSPPPEDTVTVAAAPAVWAGLDHLGPDAALDFVGEVESLGFAGYWTREGFGREPFPLLAAAAMATSTLRLGTAIANVYARDPMTARAAGSTVQELSGGRFSLGLGVSHPGWVQGVRGHDYAPPAHAMATYLDALAGADYKGPAPA